MSDSESTPETDDVPADEELPDLDADGTDSGKLASILRNQLPPGVARAMSMVQQENGLARLMMQPAYLPDENGKNQVSQAEVICDMMNILRLDSKALANAAGVEITIKQMTPKKAAILLQDAIKGENLDIVEEFAKEEERREAILEALTDEGTVEELRQHKQQTSFFYQAAESGGYHDEEA